MQVGKRAEKRHSTAPEEDLLMYIDKYFTACDSIDHVRRLLWKYSSREASFDSFRRRSFDQYFTAWDFNGHHARVLWKYSRRESSWM